MLVVGMRSPQSNQIAGTGRQTDTRRRKRSVSVPAGLREHLLPPLLVCSSRLQQKDSQEDTILRAPLCKGKAWLDQQGPLDYVNKHGYYQVDQTWPSGLQVAAK